ncbi:MAG TPA: ATP-binding protein [Pirellulales bacterium]|jgi:PAS domain S-box-containing protein|nr:ATP-binding protein [Pirellulales bacterium]
MARILIVEDNPVEAREACFFIRGAGIETDVAGDAEQGFEKLRSGHYDLLLADLHLPGENGFRLCRRVKSDEQLSRLPVVLLTRFADPVNVLRGLEAGADGFISKGQDPAEIIARLTRILSRAAEAGQEAQARSSDRVVFLHTEFELDASRNQLLEVLLSGFEDAVCLNRKYEQEVAAHARAQKSVRDLTVLYQSLVETLPLGIVRKDLDGKYIFANSQFCSQWKKQPTEIVGKTDAELFPPELAGQYRQDDAEVLRTGKVLNRVQACDGAEGAPQYIHVRRVPLRNSKHELIGIQAIVSDVTEMKRAEQQLTVLNQSLEERVAQRTQELAQRNAQLEHKNAELDQYAYIASHDLQEPLRKVISFSQLLEQDVGPALNDTARKDLYYIVEAAQRMRKLVQDLLAYSRAGRSAMNLELVSLDKCVDRALDAIALRVEESGAQLSRDSLPEVYGDRTLLTQLYQNLICNALKFVRDRKPVIRLTAESDGRHWTLGVEDNGIGIAPEYRQQIFGPFQRLHSRSEYEGTGVGLAICQTTVERHGGMIWVESQPGIGSHFKFTLKCEHAAAERHEEPLAATCCQ